MADFSSFLKQRVGRKRAPFHLHWISSYHRFRGTVKGSDTAGKSDDPDGIGAFVAWLSHRHEDWQVQQAKEAVSLFLYYNRTKGKGSRIDSPPSEERKVVAPVQGGNNRGTGSMEREDRQGWPEAGNEITKVLRLRHLSYRTQKTYLGWIRRFSVFLEHGNPEDVVEADVKDFLTRWRSRKEYRPQPRSRPSTPCFSFSETT